MARKCNEGGRFLRFAEGLRPGIPACPQRFRPPDESSVNPRADPADLRSMDPVGIITALAVAALVGLAVLAAMASRIDNAERFARLIRDTKRLRRMRAAAEAAPPPGRRRH
jgi:hypothetical protein